MTNAQMQYAFWERMRRQQLYRRYVAGATPKVQYDKISGVSDSYFLNYIEYDAKNISPDTANRYFKTTSDNFWGMCTGVHKGNKVLRQLDWYYNQEAEFIIRMKKCDETGVLYDSIGVTATSPKLTRWIVRDHIENNRYNSYFDILPYMTVDGVNEMGIYAQSNVVEVNGEKNININESGTDCCYSIMLVRFILDHVGRIDDDGTHDYLREYLETLHLYNAPREMISYNTHILVADAQGRTRIIEFRENGFDIVDKFPVMTNFRVNNDFDTVGEGENTHPDWATIEWNGQGVERWDLGIQFVKDPTKYPTVSNFKQLRNSLNFTNAYVSSYVDTGTWLTDCLSGNLSVSEAKAYHDGEWNETRKELFDKSLYTEWSKYDQRNRDEGNLTWHTTHSCIYDLEQKSFNIQSQQDGSWNVQFDGTITADS